MRESASILRRFGEIPPVTQCLRGRACSHSGAGATTAQVHRGLPGTPRTSPLRRRRHLEGLQRHPLCGQKGHRPCYWVYVCNTLSEDGVSFEEASEAVAFIAGHYLADKWHQEMNEKMEAAQQQSDEDEASHLTQPE